ncbi:MAG: DUF167 domain-containing protein [Bacillota bacterium]|uniref:DUF167 domain-containing protein n=1 Tax=Desulfurispora thermophila TaxID=265470 RepID=UPI0003736303|nr:DUF167 domain-containing protein [Desulfurispora thermophila]
MLYFKSDAGGVTFKVRVQPRAARDELGGLWDDSLKIRLCAPPVEGEANRACCKFLAGLLRVPVSAVEILKGQTGRSKLVRVRGLDEQQVRQRLGL